MTTKTPQNKIKRAVKIAYLAQKPIQKVLYKTNILPWAKVAKVEQEALLGVGTGLWANSELSVDEVVAALGQSVPAPTAGGIVETLLNPARSFAAEVFVVTFNKVFANLG